MPEGGPSTDATWVQWALGGVAAAGALVTGWLVSQIAKLRGEDATARAALWARVNDRVDFSGQARLDDARIYATKADMLDLGARIERRLDRQDDLIAKLIANRPPVQEP